MAHHKIQMRIERVLGKPQPGTGIVKFAGWTLVLILAVPVLYSAAALQVKSEPATPDVTHYTAEFGRNPLLQTPTDGQAVATLAPITLSQAQQKFKAPKADLRNQLQMELESQNLQRQYLELQMKLQAVVEEGQARGGPTSDFQKREVQEGLDFLREDAKRLEKRIGELNLTIPQNMEHVSAVLDAVEKSIAKIDKTVEAINSAGTPRGEPATNSRNRIFVTGRVQKPGDFELGDPLTVLQALALAGGFQDYAKMDAISIIRMNGESSTLLHFNYSEVIKGVNISQNIYLANGDVVVVP